MALICLRETPIGSHVREVDLSLTSFDVTYRVTIDIRRKIEWLR